jgi:hypothetical protein
VVIVDSAAHGDIITQERELMNVYINGMSLIMIVSNIGINWLITLGRGAKSTTGIRKIN